MSLQLPDQCHNHTMETPHIVKLFNIVNENHFNALMDQTWQMYQAGILVDTFLSGKDDETTIRCHISVLASFSPVIKACAIKARTSHEADMGYHIKLNFCEFSTVKMYVDFVYSGYVQCSETDIGKLLHASKRLEDRSLESAIINLKNGPNINQSIFNKKEIPEGMTYDMAHHNDQRVVKLEQVNAETVMDQFGIVSARKQGIKLEESEANCEEITISVTDMKDFLSSCEIDDRTSETSEDEDSNEVSATSVTDGKETDHAYTASQKTSARKRKMESPVDDKLLAVPDIAFSDDVPSKTKRRGRPSKKHLSFMEYKVNWGNKSARRSSNKVKQRKTTKPKKCSETNTKDSVTKEKKNKGMSYCDKCALIVCSHREKPITQQELDFHVLSTNATLKQCTRNTQMTKQQAHKYEDILGLKPLYIKQPTSNWKTSLYQCPHCNLYLVTFYRLLLHLHLHNVELPKMQCPLCERSNYTKGSLRKHDRKAHNCEGRIGQKNGTFQCEECDVSYVTEFALQIHRDNHNHDLQFLKNVRESPYKYKLKLNTETQHFNRVYTCDICGFDVNDHYDFSHHLKKQHGIEPDIDELPDAEPDEIGEDLNELNIEGEVVGHKKPTHNIEHSQEEKNSKMWKCSKCAKVICKHRGASFKISQSELDFCISDQGMTLVDNPEQVLQPASTSHLSGELEAILNLKSQALVDPADDTRKVLYHCPYCEFYLIGFSGLLTHVRVHDIDYPELLCPLCPRSYKSLENLSKHDRKNHKGLCKKGEEGGTFSCSECGTAYLTPQALERHSANHKNDLQFIKNKRSCKYSYTKKYNPETKCYNRVYKCQICDHEESDVAAHEYHMAKHGLKAYPCSQCEKNFKTQKLLEIHMNIHTGATPYMCQICGASFSSPTSFNRHVNHTHSDKRPYKCEICDLAYKTHNNRDSHQDRVHKHYVLPEGETSDFQCSNCGCFLPTEKMLRIHLKYEKDTTPVRCRVCNMGFKYHSSRIVHEKKVHGDQYSAHSQAVTHEETQAAAGGIWVYM